MPKLRILLAYDDGSLGESLRTLINGQLDMKVVAEAANARAAADCAREERPDVVLLDLALPDADTPAAVAAVRHRSPHSALLVLTTHDDPAHLAAALAAGATGFVVKPAADQELLSAIRAVHGGRTFIDVDQAPDLATTPARRPPPSAL